MYIYRIILVQYANIFNNKPTLTATLSCLVWKYLWYFWHIFNKTMYILVMAIFTEYYSLFYEVYSAMKSGRIRVED